jgi:hypothetical protein
MKNPNVKDEVCEVSEEQLASLARVLFPELCKFLSSEEGKKLCAELDAA